MKSVEEFSEEARIWLDANASRRPMDAKSGWGEGSDDVSIFHNLAYEDEKALLDRAKAWQQKKSDAGFGAITWPQEWGGAGLSQAHKDAFEDLEAEYVTPDNHETFSITQNLIAPTINLMGTDEQRSLFMRRFLRTEELCCQLFSEPGSGSDLASLSTRAERDGDEWVINGQKVWSSGAHFAEWGELITRTDPDVVKHAGMTVFMLKMDTPGVEIRPIRQMSGGSSFCEVFFNNVRIPDSMRIGDVGEGWKVTLTTLGFERGNSTRMHRIGGGWREIRALGEHFGADDHLIRQKMMDVYIGERVGEMSGLRTQASRKAGAAPGPEGSIAKLAWVQQLDRVARTAEAILGPRVTADTGDWGTWAWTQHILGAPGYHIAGGSDEIQRNIMGERALGLPMEPRADRGPWRDLPR